MHTVVSLGSINVDHVGTVDTETIAELAARYDWFPKAGETMAVDSVPAALDALIGDTYLGGKGANQAVAAARAGASTALLSAVGVDHEDYAVCTELARCGVDVDGVALADAPTGAAYVWVEPNGENRIAIVEGANGDVTPEYVRTRLDTVHNAACLLLQNEIPAETTEFLLSELDDTATRPTVVFNPAPVDGTDAFLAHPSVDVLVANRIEYAALQSSLRSFDGVVVRTRGADAILVETRDAGGVVDQFTHTTLPADPVDTTGAGDVFAGYLGAQLATGSSLRRAVEVAATAASLSVEREGVQRATPDAATVERALAGR